MDQLPNAQPVVHGRIPEELRYDVVVIGGGVAGVCAAVAAARHGSRVALIQDRPVLGGNSSSEVRVWAVGAATCGYFRNARETGIVEEVTIETAYRSEGVLPIIAEPWPLWDLVLKEWCDREPTLDLFLNTRAHAVAVIDSRIVAVEAIQISTEKAFRLHAKYFIESSGDGEVGAKAGAIWRLGQESRGEFGESFAPERPSRDVLPSTIMFAARDVGRPVRFHPLAWAYDFPSDRDLPYRHPTYFKSGYWWIETGGDHDTIKDNEAIRDELYKILFGVWDHIKNHGDHGADNLALEWVGHVVGKRESRRFEGDYVMVQDDVLYGRTFPDAVAYGGWPIDLHPSRGIFDPSTPSKMADPEKPFGIPFRSLYSRNIDNLFLNGRLLSASHIAMGAIRVQKTLGVVGEAVGTAAAFCVQLGIPPRELGQEYIHQLQQELLRQGCYIPHIGHNDSKDIARAAKITASSRMPLAVVTGEQIHGLYTRRAQKFSTSKSRIERVSVWLVSERNDDVVVTVHLRPAHDLWDFSACQVLGTAHATLTPQYDGWVSFSFNQAIDPSHPYWIEIETEEGVGWRHSLEEPYGCQAAAWSDDRFSRTPLNTGKAQTTVYVERSEAGESVGSHLDGAGDGVWRHLRGTYRFQVEPPPDPYGPTNIISGASRPSRGADCWISDPQQPLPQWLELDFGRPVTFDTLQITFDSNLDRQMDEGHRAMSGPIPELLKAYTTFIWHNSNWQQLFAECDNHQRCRRHTFPPVTTERLRIVCEATHGDGTAETHSKAPQIGTPITHDGWPRAAYTVARIFEVRMYHEAIAQSGYTIQ